jgi:hypothetical protein
MSSSLCTVRHGDMAFVVPRPLPGEILYGAAVAGRNRILTERKRLEAERLRLEAARAKLRADSARVERQAAAAGMTQERTERQAARAKREKLLALWAAWRESGGGGTQRAFATHLAATAGREWGGDFRSIERQLCIAKRGRRMRRPGRDATLLERF